MGQRYTPPASGNGIFSGDTSDSIHRALLSHDSVATSFDLEVHADGTVTAPERSDFHMRIQQDTGLFTGRFHDESGVRKIRGAVLQGTHQGRGFYLVDDGTGSFAFEPAR